MKKWERLEKKRAKRLKANWRKFERRGGLRRMGEAAKRIYGPLTDCLWPDSAMIEVYRKHKAFLDENR